MMRSLQIAATGMSAQELNVDTISNNLANMNTTGYKSTYPEFVTLLYQSMNREVGAQTNVGGQISPISTSIGLGVRTTGIFTDNSQGPLTQTNNTYDLAIQGNGFFQVTDASGNIYYTRAGSFNPNQNGILVDPQGYTLDPAITIPSGATSVTINSQGEVLVSTDATTATTTVGRIALVNFLNPSGLKPVGNSDFIQTDASGTPLSSNPGEQGYGTLQQGYIESSNVDAVSALSNLIVAQRAYEMNSKVITTADEMEKTVTTLTT